MKTNRVEAIVAGMTSFDRASYYRSEVLQELFKLQNEIVGLTFNEEHADTANLKLWDVEKHFEQMNEELDHVADLELGRFEEGCKVICSEIKAIISGNRGEYKAFKSLDDLEEDCIILKNVELSRGNEKTELDAVVITGNGIFIIEVKNTAKDVFIDDEGNYYRTGEFLKWDSHIGGKMSLRENMLRDLLVDAGIENPSIKSIVVFTNNHIEVRNKYKGFKTCFLSQLPYIISDGGIKEQMDQEMMRKVADAVEHERCMEKYPFSFDVAGFKHDFAVLMDKLENASSTEEIDYESEQCESDFAEQVNLRPVKPRWRGYALTALGAAAATLVTVMAAGSVIGRR